MDAGRLDRRISIMRNLADYRAPDALNERTEIWHEHACRWASYRPISDGERLKTGQTLADHTARFTIRWSSEVADVNPKDRVLFDGRTFDILGVKEIGRREWLEITGAARADT